MNVTQPIALLLFLFAATAGIAKEFRIDFQDPAVKAAIAACPYAKLEKDFEQTDVLTIEVPNQGADISGQNLVRLPIDLRKMDAVGYTVYCEGDVSYRDVSKPAQVWNGVKFMLPLDSKTLGESHPSFLRLHNRQKSWGSEEWFKTSGRADIPPDVEKAWLCLGLQGSSGTASFRNIRLSRGDKAPVSTLRTPVIPKAAYTVDPPRLLGVMSPNTENKGPKEQDFADLAAWGANGIRWQLIVPRIDGEIPTMAQAKRYLDGKIDELQQVLDLGQKYGIRVVIDVHSTSAFSKKMLLGTPEGRDYLVEFWEKTARRYHGHPALFGYNLINEPHSREMKDGDPSLVEQYQRMIGAIRNIDPVTPIIIESDYMAAPRMLQFLPVFPVPNIIYSIHMYSPGTLTHQLDPAANSFLKYPDSARQWDKEYLRRELAIPREFQQKTGARIYVGEFGCIRWAPGADRYLKDCIELFEEYGWDWTYHAFREWHGWSVEHSENPKEKEIVPMTSRKQVLLDAFKLNLP